MSDHEAEKVLREEAQHENIACEICLKEIPKSLAHTFEGEDYVLYFCGVDCHYKWEHNNQTNNAK